MTPDEKNKIEARIAELEREAFLQKSFAEDQYDDPHLCEFHSQCAEDIDQQILSLRSQLEKE